MKKPENNPYKPIYSVKKSTHKSRQIQKATQKLSTQHIHQLCQKMGFCLTVPQANALHDYLFLLQKWNQSMNLVGKNTWEEILQELIVDSLHLGKYLNEHICYCPQNLPFMTGNDKIHAFQYHENSHTFETWDLGAGAGLPGIPLRMLWNQGKYTLVESREKRSLFLNMACTKLGLEETIVCRDRAENFMENKAKEQIKAKLIISRAFMPYEKMLPFVAPYIESAENHGSILFLTLEKIDATKFNTEKFQWNTKNFYEYKVQGKKKYFCEIEKISE